MNPAPAQAAAVPAPPRPPILEAQHLSKRYGGRTVVKDVSLAVAPGEIVGLLGPNGAGKTTSFRMTMGMIAADTGTVAFDGHDVSGLAMYQRARLGMGYLAQEPSVFQRLSVEDNLLAVLEMRGVPKAERLPRAEAMMRRFDLLKCRAQPARTCSGGERRKLEISRALLCEPKVILLDEPFAAVDPVTVEALQEQVRELAHGHGMGILVTDHSAHHMLELCDRLYVIAAGEVFAAGTPPEIIANPLVRKTYLGESFRA